MNPLLIDFVSLRSVIFKSCWLEDVAQYPRIQHKLEIPESCFSGEGEKKTSLKLTFRPLKRPSSKETYLPTVFQARAVRFREVGSKINLRFLDLLVWWLEQIYANIFPTRW